MDGAETTLSCSEFQIVAAATENAWLVGYYVFLPFRVGPFGVLDRAVYVGNIRSASKSCSSDAGRVEAACRVGLPSSVARYQWAARLQRSTRPRVRLLRLQDAPSAGQF